MRRFVLFMFTFWISQFN